MLRNRTVPLIGLLLTMVFSSAADAGWLHQVNSVFQATKAKQRQPRMLEQMIVNPYEAADYSICFFFAHGANPQSKGKVVTKVRIEDEEGNLQRKMKLTASVRRGSAWRCKDGTDLTAGALVRFEHTLKKMPHLRTVNDIPQGVAITGVISTDGRPAVGDGPLALEPPKGEIPRGYVPGSEGGWFNSANSVYQARSNGTDHPTVMNQVIELPRDTGSKPYVCSAYNSSPDVPKNKGSVATTATLSYSDGTMETLELTGDVEDHVHSVCEKASKKLKKGDLVAFEHDLSSMPKLDKGDHADLVGALSATGEPGFRGDLSGPPAPGDVFTTADEHAITRVLSQKAHQLRRQERDRPDKWVIVTPRSVPDPNRHGYNLRDTIGAGPTVAEALIDYESRMGSLGGTGRLLTQSERREMEWFSRMSSAGGPTTIRVDNSRKFHGDVYRQHLGVQLGGPFSTIEQTVGFFKNLGL